MVPPRGCDLSFRITLLAWLDPERARARYDAYTERFWVERDGLVGSGEWERGEPRGAGHDSGPVVRGRGTRAHPWGMRPCCTA